MKIIKVLLFICLFCIISLTSLFLLLPTKYITLSTISNISTYAKHYPESPKSDKGYWENPTFTTFYNTYFYTPWYQNMLIKLGFREPQQLDLKKIKLLLHTLTTKRKKDHIKNKTFIATPGDQYILWGDLHGAFHSMVRTLQELKKRKIINNNLEIIKKNTTFIFLGDAISRSPYSLELLNIILLLLEKNPQKVFYLRGNHEHEGHWEDFSMAETVVFKTGLRPLNIDIPPFLSKPFNEFFKTLPSSLIIKQKDGKEKIVCAHSKIEKKLTSDITVKAILSGEKRLKQIKDTPGLAYLGFKRGIAQWSILSCPIHIYQTFFNFYYDAFVELTIGTSISESVLTLYNNDIRTAPQFNVSYYQPIFGYPLPNKKSDLAGKNIINVGSTMSLFGAGKDKIMEMGFSLALLKFNVAKNQNLIRPVFLSDEYKPNRALRNVKKLYNTYKIDTLILPSGTPTLETYLYMVKSGKITVLFPNTGAAQFRKPELKQILHFRASYKQEAKALLDHFIKKHNINNFAFFYQNDSFGKPIDQMAHKTLQHYGITKWIDLPYARTQVNFKPIVKKLKQYAPDAIGCFSGFYPTINLISNFGAKFLFDRTIFGLSDLAITPFKLFLKEAGINMIVSHIVPSPNTSTLEIAKEFRNIIKKRKILASDDLFEGYTSGSLLIDAINHLKPPFTAAKILGYFENLKNYNFKGLTLTFNPEKRDLSQPVWIKNKPYKSTTNQK